MDVLKKYAFLIVVTFSACKINQLTNGKRTGKWVEKQVANGDNYKFIGSYRTDGTEKGTWKNFRNDTLTSRQRFQGNISSTKNFYGNGRLLSSGKSKTDRSDPEKLHWFYFGEWKYYNKQGKLEYIRTFKNGQEIKEVKVSEK